MTGSDLGQACFQFRFELEEDLTHVLNNRPFNYNNWMVILQRWEPIISPLFPSQIPFWIKVQGLPLHFWQEKRIYNIEQDLGILEDYRITKTSAKIKVSVDGLKPLITKAIIDFASGEDLPLKLEYEDLGYIVPSVTDSRIWPVTAPQHRDSRRQEKKVLQQRCHVTKLQGHEMRHLDQELTAMETLLATGSRWWNQEPDLCSTK